MANLKAQIWAQCEQFKTNLQDKETRAAHKEHIVHPKNRPNLIKAIFWSHSSLIAPTTPVHLEMPVNQPVPSLYGIDRDEMQHARMLIDSAPDAEDTNSPTPTVDIPLVVPIVATTSPPDPVIAILTAIQAQMAQTDACLKTIKIGNN
jgi:hypothetical protein